MLAEQQWEHPRMSDRLLLQQMERALVRTHLDEPD